MSLKQVLSEAIAFAAVMHKDQLDKAGEPYILHPIRVMQGVSTIEEKIVAILHDVLEDTAGTREDLASMGVPDELLLAIDKLTHRDGQTYEEYVNQIATHPVSIRVKIADMKDNLNVLRLKKKELSDKDLKRIGKYYKFIRVLEDL